MRMFMIATLVAAGLASAASAQLTAFGVTNDGRLISFDPANPSTLLNNVQVANLLPNEVMVGIDARPASASGELVIMTSLNRLLSLATTGVATPIGSGFTPALATLQGGFDFNPTVDRLRVISTDTTNRRLNPVTGASVATDTAMTFADGQGTPFVVGAAYNSFQFGTGAAVGSVRQFVVDSRRGVLGETGSQAGGNASFNGGVITVVGPLGVAISDNTGFDIFGPTQSAFLSSLGDNNQASFYTVDLTTGAATLVGTIGTFGVVDITVVPTPGAGALLGFGLVAAIRRRR